MNTTSSDAMVITDDSIQLAITTTKPAGLAKTPLIILVHGSGNDSRSNPYYQLLTEEFCKTGYAVVTYDKRGCDSSTGNWITVPFSTLKEDVLAIVNSFSGDSSITQIGLWGGSEGSNVAVWAASDSAGESIDFVIAQSFTAMTFAEQSTYARLNRINNTEGISPEMRDSLMKIQELLLHFVRTGNGYTEYVTLSNSFSDEPWHADLLGAPVSENGLWSRWYRTKLDLDNMQFLPKLDIPVLFIWGSEDELIDLQKSMALVQQVAIGKDFTLKSFDGADHSLYAGGRNPVHLGFMKEWLEGDGSIQKGK